MGGNKYYKVYEDETEAEKAEKRQKDKRVVCQKNRQKIQTSLNPY